MGRNRQRTSLRAVVKEAGVITTSTSELRTIAAGNIYSETKTGRVEKVIKERETVAIEGEQAKVNINLCIFSNQNSIVDRRTDTV